MDLLVIGGTVFLGRQTVRAALDRGWSVTMFNRGQHNPELFPEAEKLRGDRDGGLDVLRGRSWEAVVDTCGYFPRVVRDSARLLKDQTGHYTFISSISVYADTTTPGVDESSAVGTIDDPTVERVTGETYGPLKALCEQAAEEAMPGRTLVIRPGLIAGPYDPSGRFTYWPMRIAKGGRVLAPPADRRVQIIDARDIAGWNLDLIERGVTGVFNATGPERPTTMRETLEACGRAELVFATDEFLVDNKVGPWMQLPLWIAGGDGLMRADVSKAFAEGLQTRPVGEIARDIVAARDTPIPDGVGLTPERERELLEAWDAR